MKIYISKYCGFCFGVSLAVKAAYENLNKKKQLVMFGEVVHNKNVIEELKEKGVKNIENIKELQNENNSIVLIRAHGVPKQIITELKKKNIETIDKTCPKVKKIYEIVENANKKGQNVIVIGNPEHPEIIGILGWSNSKTIIIRNLEEAKEIIPKFEFSKKGVCLVSQTTFNTEQFKKISKYCNENINGLIINNTICNSTENRQVDIEGLSRKVETVIIIGGKNSSNTTKLYEISLENCKNTYHIENGEDLKEHMLKNSNSIAISTGSSTPKEIVENVVEKIKDYCKVKKIELEVIGDSYV